MDKSPSSPRPFSAPRYALTLLAVLLAWTGLYVSIQPLATWLTFDLLSLTPGGAPGLALEFFLYDSAKILLLLVLMVYCIGWLRAGLHVERVRDYLSGKGRGIGYLLGATFGAITPFCSCSSIPLFLGFTMARIPLGITMAFLITSPLINEIAVVLLWGLLGWKFTVVYVVVGMAAGMLGGWLLDLLRAERWLQPFLRGMLAVRTAIWPRSLRSLCSSAMPSRSSLWPPLSSRDGSVHLRRTLFRAPQPFYAGRDRRRRSGLPFRPDSAPPRDTGKLQSVPNLRAGSAPGVRPRAR